LIAAKYDQYHLDEMKISQKVMKKRVEILRERMLSGAVLSPLASIFLAWTQAIIVGWETALEWFCLINCFELCIVVITYGFRNSSCRERNEASYLTWMIFSEFLVGIGWGCSVWFFWRPDYPEYYLLNLVLLVGVAGVCIVVLSPFANSMAALATGIFIPVLVHLAIIPEQLKLPIIAGASILFFLIIHYARLAEKALIGGLENAERLEEISSELIQRTQNLSELSAHIDQTEEQGRLKISREIHDEMGGNLAALKMSLYVIENSLPASQPTIAAKIRYMEDLIDRTIDAGHRIALGLRPGILDLGIIPALQWQVEEFKRQYSIDCRFSSNCAEIVLTPECATALFRMAQEALTNAAKHSQSRQVNVAILSMESNLLMKINDDGCGFDHTQTKKANAFGLLGMAERCKEIGGTILVESNPGQGCTITIKIPLMEEEKNVVYL